MHANNELGTVQPVAEIAAIAREAGVYLHVDGVQALGKIPVDVEALGADLYSVTGHKIYAPKGIGALYVRRGTRLGAIQFGGHHLAINVTVVGPNNVMTPSLPAAQPARYTLNGQTIRPLGRENDKGFALINTLNPAQQKKACLLYTSSQIGRAHV